MIRLGEAPFHLSEEAIQWVDQTKQSMTLAERLDNCLCSFTSSGNPYNLYEVPSIPTVINAYNATAPVMTQIVECLVGAQPFLGISPVDAFCGLEWAQL